MYISEESLCDNTKKMQQKPTTLFKDGIFKSNLDRRNVHKVNLSRVQIHDLRTMNRTFRSPDMLQPFEPSVSFSEAEWFARKLKTG